MAPARRRLRLTFPSDLIHEPIIYRLAREFDIVVTVRRAEVTSDHGSVALEADADEEQLERGIAWLAQQGIKVEPIG